MPWFSPVFSRTRFRALRRYFHLKDNTKRPDKNHNDYKLYQVIPIISCLTKTFGSLYVPFQNVSIDEMLLGTKCQLSFTRYQENILQVGMMFEGDVLLVPQRGQLRTSMWTKSVRNIYVKCVLKSTTLGPMYKYISILLVVIASVYKNNLFCFICIQYYNCLGLMSVIKVIQHFSCFYRNLYQRFPA